jgi:hypothetical protein
MTEASTASDELFDDLLKKAPPSDDGADEAKLIEDIGARYGVRTTLRQSSSCALKVSYPFAASANFIR